MNIRISRPATGPVWLDMVLTSIEGWLRRLDAPTVVTVATVPDATLNIGRMIFVANEAGGAVMAFSDGTSWRRVTDRAVIS